MEFFYSKSINIKLKNCDRFLISAQTQIVGTCTFAQLGGSNEHLQSMF